MINLKKEKLIIFDVDGVIEVEEKINKVREESQIKAICEKHNTDKKNAKRLLNEAYQNLPRSKRETTAYRLEYLGFSRNEYIKLINSVKPDGLIECHKNCLKTLKELSKDFHIIAYSNTPKEATIRTLKYLKVWMYIKKCYAADDFYESKPSVKNLKTILNQQGYKASDVFVVGNSPSKDIVPANQIGATTILFNFQKHFDKKNANYIINDLWEIVDIVRK